MINLSENKMEINVTINAEIPLSESCPGFKKKLMSEIISFVPQYQAIKYRFQVCGVCGRLYKCVSDSINIR